MKQHSYCGRRTEVGVGIRLQASLPCLPTISATCSELGTGTHSVMLQPRPLVSLEELSYNTHNLLFPCRIAVSPPPPTLLLWLWWLLLLLLRSCTPVVGAPPPSSLSPRPSRDSWPSATLRARESSSSSSGGTSRPSLPNPEPGRSPP